MLSCHCSPDLNSPDLSPDPDLAFSCPCDRWGWGTDAPGVGSNVVANNSIKHFCLQLDDCGAIYTLSALPNVRAESKNPKLKVLLRELLWLDLLDRLASFTRDLQSTIERNWLHEAPVKTCFGELPKCSNNQGIPTPLHGNLNLF